MPDDAHAQRSRRSRRLDSTSNAIDPLREVHSGWRAFSDRDYASAATHFARVVVHLPMVEEARVGLREALKSQGRLYRLIRPLCFRVEFKEDRREFSEGIPIILDVLVVGTLLGLGKSLMGVSAAMALVTALWLVPVCLVRTISASATVSLRRHHEGLLILPRGGLTVALAMLG